MSKAGRLGIVQIGEKLYYEDIRLSEYRNVEDFSDRILFSDLGLRKVTRVENRIEFGTPEWDAHIEGLNSKQNERQIKKQAKRTSKRRRL